VTVDAVDDDITARAPAALTRPPPPTIVAARTSSATRASWRPADSTLP